MLLPVEIARHRHVDQHLRVQDQIGGQLGERAAQLTHCVQHLERGHDAVAGGVLVEADYVSRVLAAQLPAPVAQQLEHVAIADAGARERDAEPGHRLLEGVIRHQGAGDAGQRFFRRAMLGDGVKQLVAVISAPRIIDDQDAVAVAVQSDPQIGGLIFHLAYQAVGRSGARSLVDIEAVGLDADRDDVGAELMENVRRDVVGRAMRAVDDDLHALQVELRREGGFAELDIAPAGIVDAARASQPGGLIAAHRPRHLFLDRRFGAVGQLEAVARKELDAVIGIRVVISASHNPYPDNGIKFFSGDGFKLPDGTEAAIEEQMARPMGCNEAARLGRARRVDDAGGRYIEFCKSTFPAELDLKGMKVVVDCAHGAAYNVAPHVFHELGADVVPIGVKPDGLNINEASGATSPGSLLSEVKNQAADLGVALDGDGDRVLIVDDAGRAYDGDQLLSAVAKHRAAKKTLPGVAGTLMTNYAFEKAMARLGVPFARARVGDRYVLELLRDKGWELGGENSGHIICLDKHTTGDGIVSALQVLHATRRSEERRVGKGR